MTETARSPYQLGNYFEVMPIPAIPEHCITIEAGPLHFVVESRQLTDEIAYAAGATGGGEAERREGYQFDDYGASLHVFGAVDGLEHLRFDCFEKEPHYHYVRHGAGGNLICRIDEIADGDPIDWTLGRLRERLPEMLEFAGVPELAAQTRASEPHVQSVIHEVEALLARARAQAISERTR